MPSAENASFNPTPVQPYHSRDPRCKPVCRRLTFTDSLDDEATMHTQSNSAHQLHLQDVDSEEEEDFQTVSLNDEHW